MPTKRRRSRPPRAETPARRRAPARRRGRGTPARGRRREVAPVERADEAVVVRAEDLRAVDEERGDAGGGRGPVGGVVGPEAEGRRGAGGVADVEPPRGDGEARDGPAAGPRAAVGAVRRPPPPAARVADDAVADGDEDEGRVGRRRDGDDGGPVRAEAPRAGQGRARRAAARASPPQHLDVAGRGRRDDDRGSVGGRGRRGHGAPAAELADDGERRRQPRPRDVARADGGDARADGLEDAPVAPEPRHVLVARRERAPRREPAEHGELEGDAAPLRGDGVREEPALPVGLLREAVELDLPLPAVRLDGERAGGAPAEEVLSRPCARSECHARPTPSWD